MSEPKVSVIIPNWNGLANIVECLEALYRIDYSSFEVLVVDNNSADGSPAAIEERFPGVRVIRNSENLGFAEGCNVGIRQAIQSGADYVWLLNNDAIVDGKSLKSLVSQAETEASVGMTGSKIYYYEQPQVIWGVGMRIDWICGETISIGWNELDVGQFNHSCEVEGLAGCSLLVKRKVCEEVGLMDRDYFLYAEEIDWCVRARLGGFKCVFVPESIVFHKGGASSGGRYRTIFSYYNTRNMLKTIKKNVSFPKREIYLCTAIVTKLWKIRREFVKAAIVWALGKKAYKFDVSTLLGVIDFVLNKKGAKDQKLIMAFRNFDRR